MNSWRDWSAAQDINARQSDEPGTAQWNSGIQAEGPNRLGTRQVSLTIFRVRSTRTVNSAGPDYVLLDFRITRLHLCAGTVKRGHRRPPLECLVAAMQQSIQRRECFKPVNIMKCFWEGGGAWALFCSCPEPSALSTAISGVIKGQMERE